MHRADELPASIFVLKPLSDFVPAIYLLRRIPEIVTWELKVMRSPIRAIQR